jgi:hypothetical protein
MTVIDAPKIATGGEDAELLFREARQRRRGRWLAAGIAAIVLLAILGVTIGLVAGSSRGSQVTPAATPVSFAASRLSPAQFSVRPVLCYAPPLALATGHSASSGPLPTCTASTALTAANLQVTPDSRNSNGYLDDGNIPEDPEFATYPDTSAQSERATATVLLPGRLGEGSGRYVLGPAQLVGSAVKSAGASDNNGQWMVTVDLTAAGTVDWDTLARQQFHAIVGIVYDSHVLSAPIIQPTQTSFTSFNGQLVLSGSFTERQAKAIAARL